MGLGRFEFIIGKSQPKNQTYVINVSYIVVSTYYAAQKNLNENIVLPISCTPARKLLVAKYLVRGRVRQRCVGEVYEL